MAVNFPDAPSNGDSFSVNDTTYVYNATAGYWDITSTVQASASTGTNAPSNPSAGDFWFDPSSLTTYIYYSDGTSSQWIPANSVGARGAPGPGYPTSYYSVDYTSTTTGNVVFNSSSTPTLPSYTVGKVNAWVNGVLRSDIDATDGSNVEISLSTGDEVQIINFGDTDVLDPTASSNDHTTYTTLSSLIDTVQSNVTSAGSGVAVYATPDLLPLTGTDAGEQAYVNSTNRLYINNGTGWYSIGLVNSSPTITSVLDGDSNNTPFTLSTDGSSSIITITAADPEDVPLTYSYAVTTGSLTNGGGTTATVVQGTGANTNQFTITPTTTEAYAGTFDLTFTTSDGINTATNVNRFTLSFITTIANSNYTTLLATATGTSDNNNITDASTNNHTITVSGDTHAGTFSPYRSGGYSGLFDSTSVVQLSFAGSSDFEFGTGNFTIEMWFKWNSSSKPDTTIFSNRITSTSFNTGGFYLQFAPGDLTTGGIEFAFDCGTPRYRLYCVDNLTADDAFFDEGWHHYAAVRNGTSLKLFVDGQEVDEITLPANETNFGINSKDIGLGINPNVSSPSGPNGEYRDVRIVKGVAIIPPSGGPTEPLDAVSGTTLLLYNGEGYVKDKASNHSATYGSTAPTITATGPYDYEEYSATDNGGSVYFDGTGDYLLINNPPTLGANDWTFETWYYSASAPLVNNNVLLSQGPGNNGIVSNFSVSSTGEIWIQTYTTTNVVLYNTAAGIIKGGMWNHIVLTHDYDGSNGGTYKIYANGNQVGNVSYTSGYYWNSGGISGTPLAMAQYRYNTQANSECYFSDWKISNSVIYSSDFIPPTAPLSSSGASLHIKGTDASIIDKSQNSNLKLVGNTTGSTTTNFTGSKSMYFDGSDDYISLDANNDLLDFSYGNGDFTIEGWFYFNSLPTSASNAPKLYIDIDSSTTYWQLYLLPDGLTLRANNTGIYIIESTITWSTNTWYHISLSRSASTYSVHVDGDRVINTTTTHQIGNHAYKTIGGTNLASAQSLNGYIQDFRITKGLARYTAADESANIPSAPLKG